MIWFRDLLLGVFTRHLGTKLLALLLSIGLFGFVQASLRATHEIRQLTLQFSLVPQLRNEQEGSEAVVLLKDEVTFNNLLISGMRAKVDPLAKLYAGKPTVPLEIDQRFLSRYGERYGEDRIRLRISRDLFADDALFGRDVTVGEFNEPVVELDKLVSRDVRVEVDTTAMPAVITNPDHEYAGTKLHLSANVKSVSLQGPASAFTTGERVILVSVKGIEDELSKVQVTGEQGTARLTKVEISWKGIAAELLPRMRVSAPALSSDPLSVQEFRKKLVVSCEVTKKKVDKTLSDVPIEIRYPTPRKRDLSEDYQDGVTFLDTDLKDGFKQELKVRLPRSLAGNQDFLKRLVIVLNVGAATEDPQATELLSVPYRLDLKHPAGVDDAANLALVEILLPGGAGAPQAVAEFRRKK